MEAAEPWRSARRWHWIAEHQPRPQPLLLIAMVAARTRSIRVGTAGLLFHFYPPSRTAFDFRFLAASFPGRIDAGVCRGRVGGKLEVDQLDGRDRATHLARYPQRVAALVRHLRQNGTEETAGPIPGEPEVWSLGSGSGSAGLAARHGLRFGYSLFHSDSMGDPAVPDLYRSRFAPRVPGGRPHVAVAVAGVCAETDKRAQSLAARHANRFVRPTVVGSPATCRSKLTGIARRRHADEIVFTSLRLPCEERVASFRALAEAWRGLSTPS